MLVIPGRFGVSLGDPWKHIKIVAMGNAVSMGEAAGTAAALAAGQGCLPHEVAWDDIATRLTT